MKGYKKLTILITALVLTVVASVVLYQYGSKIGTTQAAKARLRSEYIQLKKDNISLSEENQNLEQKVAAIDEKRQNLINTDAELKKSTELIAEYQKKNEELQNELNAINTPGELNSKYNNQINQISNAKTGDVITYSDVVLVSGKDISAGRYCISGDGSFRIIKKTNNNIVESQNVGLLESDSYTTNVDAECTIIIEGTLDFTPVD